MSLLYLCPHCQAEYSLQLLPLTSGLGPASYVCRKCAQPFLTGRRDWAEMSPARKAWYRIYTLLLILGVGAAFGEFGMVWEIPIRGSSSIKPTHGLRFWAIAGAAGAAVLVLQERRVAWSLRRTKGLDPASPVARFWSIDSNPQWFFLLALVFLFLVPLPLFLWMVGT